MLGQGVPRVGYGWESGWDGSWQIVCGADEVGEYLDGYGGPEVIWAKVLWVMPQTMFSSLKSSYVAYGNKATLGYTYRNMCLIAEVLALGKQVKNVKEG